MTLAELTPMRSATAPGDLVERARRLDPEAWDELYVEVYPKLLGYATRRVGNHRAADVVAETMARAVGAIERFDASGPGFHAWLFGICRHVVADTHRAATRDEGRREPATVPVDDISDGLEQDEEAAAMRTAYTRLSDDDREVLDLRVVGGLSADEVAAVLGKQPGTVRMAQSRALERLRGHFEEIYR
jgi:RNA polymerase sigma-70 factor (ECF subfamily)